MTTAAETDAVTLFAFLILTAAGVHLDIPLAFVVGSVGSLITGYVLLVRHLRDDRTAGRGLTAPPPVVSGRHAYLATGAARK